jgi:predicted metal-dependent enzyme (double-stranded beta helix superfamily)
MTVAAPTLTPLAAAMVADLRAVALGPDAIAAPKVADVLGRYVAQPGLLTEAQQVADPNCYKQHILHVEPGGTFSVVALVWMPGQRTPIHDHICWCVVGVREGAEREVLYRVERDQSGEYLVVTGESVAEPGTTTYFYPPGDIHEVANASEARVISIHVYGADVAAAGTSIRRRYDLPVRAQ